MYQLSRHAFIRREGVVLEVCSALTGRRLTVSNAAIVSLLASFTVPRPLQDVLAQLADTARPQCERVLHTLIDAGVLESTTDLDQDNYGRYWEFHDILFHTCSRLGRNSSPVGGTYRFGDTTHHENANEDMWAGRTRLPLILPEVNDDLAGGLGSLLSRRRTCYSTAEVSFPQISKLLYWSARATSTRSPMSESMTKAYPSGGGLHPLEVYLLVSRCKDLTPGLYHYDKWNHALVCIQGMTVDLTAIATSAQNSINLSMLPSVVLIVSTRHARVAHKYEGLAYRLALIETGCLYQTIYLCATALGISVCAVGRGDSEAFSNVLKRSELEETSIGEMVLAG